MAKTTFNEQPISVSPGTIRKVWAGITITIGADVSVNWQDLTMMLRDGDRTDSGALTDTACQRLAAKLGDMVARRRALLNEPLDLDSTANANAETVRDAHLDGDGCPDCLDTWPCLRLTRALRALMNRA